MSDLTAGELQSLPASKAELLDRVERGRAALERALARLSDARLVVPGADDGWSVKDHLAHLAAWEEGIAALLQRRPRYAAMGVDEATVGAGEDAINALVYEQSRDRPLAEVSASLRYAQRHMTDALAGLTDADLFKTYSHYQPDEPGEDSGAPILGWIAGNTYEHYVEHLEWIKALLG